MGWAKEIFIGMYDETILDNDGAFHIPVLFRELLEKGAAAERRAVITCFDGLRVYPEKAFMALVDNLRQSAKSQEERNNLRALTFSAHTVPFDETGRIALLSKFLSYAKLAPGDRVLLTGMGSYFEVGENAKLDIERPGFQEELGKILAQYENEVFGEAPLVITDGAKQLTCSPDGTVIMITAQEADQTNKSVEEGENNE